VVATASIGIAVTDPARRNRRDPGGEWPLSAQALLHDADLAMYQAKASGRACWRVHHPSGTDTSRDRLRLLGELRDALSDDQLRLHYQPRTDLRNATVVGYEALLRWQHPHRGLLGPAEFLPVAEESGLIRELGGWVLREACRTAAGWHAADPDRRPLDIAVNLSARQLADPHLTALVADILTDTGLDPTTLILEVTETAVMRDADTALGVLRALKSLGVRLAIDDFGTGWSSLAYLKRFPVDELKIDRSFVAGLDRDPDDTAIVTSVISLGRAVGVQVLAEGVETHQQRAKLVALDCPLAQGYLFAPPAPADQLPARQPGIPRQSPPAAPDLCED
jgi:EAL domain-containing protein (putative c-di-GMP-specific phosphodiesterase class I)